MRLNLISRQISRPAWISTRKEVKSQKPNAFQIDFQTVKKGAQQLYRTQGILKLCKGNRQRIIPMPVVNGQEVFLHRPNFPPLTVRITNLDLLMTQKVFWRCPKLGSSLGKNSVLYVLHSPNSFTNKKSCRHDDSVSLYQFSVLYHYELGDEQTTWIVKTCVKDNAPVECSKSRPLSSRPSRD